ARRLTCPAEAPQGTHDFGPPFPPPRSSDEMNRCSFSSVTRIAFRQNITIQFGSNLLPGGARGSRQSASVCIRVHPWPNRLFSLVFGQLSKFGFWATDGHGYTRIECLGFTETIH